MKQLGQVLAIVVLLLGLYVMLLVGYYSFSIVNAIISGAKSLEPSVYVPLSITVFTAVIGLTATLYTQSVSRKREIESAHRDRKLEIYLEFMILFEKLLMSEKPELGGTKTDPNETARKLLSIRTKAVLWGSPGVLKYLARLGDSGPTALDLFNTMEGIQREMRKDLGLSNFGLEKGFFSKLPLSDPEEYERMVKSDNKK
jgi:hypothetical protein